MQSPPAGSVMRFSTDDMPEREAMPYWREVFGRMILKLDFSPVNDRRLRETIQLQALPDLGVALAITNGIAGHRTKALAADSNDNLIFITVLSGKSAVSHRGQDFELGARQATLFSSAEAASQVLSEPARYLGLVIPRHALAERMNSPESTLARLVPEGNATLRLLTDYVTMATNEGLPMEASLQAAFATHVHDLVGLALGATRDAAALAEARGLRAARLHAVVAEIARGFANPGFSPAAMAGKLGLSPRYVQDLLQESGATLSERVLELRLQKARTMLSVARNDRLKVGDIALACGFNEASYFNRRFRARFGCSPTQYRGGEGGAG